MTDMASSSLGRATRLPNKPLKKYDLSAKLSLVVIGACEVDKNPHIFLTVSNKQIQEINRHFDGTLNNYGPMVFSSNQEQNESYTF